MNTIIRKSSATIKVTHQELAIMEKALREYYWNKDAEYASIKNCIRYMIQDIEISKAVFKRKF